MQLFRGDENGEVARDDKGNVLSDMKIDSSIEYLMADGFIVNMDYKVQYDAFGREYDRSAAYDVTMQCGNDAYKYKQFKLGSTQTDLYNEVRTTFVNFIQATDALLARMIMVHLKRLGAQHVTGIHDCFRVNVTELPLLIEAIKRSYMDLFGSDTLEPTDDLPYPDMLGNLFEGMNDSLKEGEEGKVLSMFSKKGFRKNRTAGLTGNSKVKIVDCINSLGDTDDEGNWIGATFFAK